MGIDARLLDCGCPEQVQENFDRVLALIDATALNCESVEQVQENFDSVIALLDATVLNCDLASMAFSGVTLDPVFSAGAITYVATTAAATTDVTATVENTAYAALVIKQETEVIASGATATLADGANVFTFTVSVGTKSKVYTVTITKGE